MAGTITARIYTRRIGLYKLYNFEWYTNNWQKQKRGYFSKFKNYYLTHYKHRENTYDQVTMVWSVVDFRCTEQNREQYRKPIKDK